MKVTLFANKVFADIISQAEILRVDPDPMTGVPIRRENLDNTNTNRRRPWEDRQRLELCCLKPRNARDCQ